MTSHSDRATRWSWIFTGLLLAGCVAWWTFARTQAIFRLLHPGGRHYFGLNEPFRDLVRVWAMGSAVAVGFALLGFVARRTPNRGWGGLALLGFSGLGLFLGYLTTREVMGVTSSLAVGLVVMSGCFLGLVLRHLRDSGLGRR